MGEWTPNCKLPQPVVRAEGELNNFTIELRWEFVRRHPIYLTCWEEVARYHSRPKDDPPARLEYGLRAKLLLSAIGVFGVPVHPATPLKEILEGYDPGLLSGSFQPMTLRKMAALLLRSLGPEEKAFLGMLMIEAAQRTNKLDAASPQTNDINNAAALSLNFQALPGFDTFGDAPLLYMHLGSSINTIKVDAVDQAKRWKRRRGIADPPKLQKQKFQGYLEAWDMREGWTGEAYDPAKAMKLEGIATRLKQPVSTIRSHYKQAFRIVIGAEYSPELWFQVFGPLVMGKATTTAAVKRRTSTAERRPVPVSKLGRTASDRPESIIEGRKPRAESDGWGELLNDFRELVGKGWTDGQIFQELDLNDMDLVRYLREHIDEIDALNKCD